MTKFHYHLQKVLDLKEKETEQAKWAFGKSVQKKIEEETKLYELNERREQMSIYISDVQTESCSAARLIDITRYTQSIDRAISVQQVTVIDCEQEMESRKSYMRDRLQESQLWQRLREKAAEQFSGAEKIREQKEMDEIGISRFLRRG